MYSTQLFGSYSWQSCLTKFSKKGVVLVKSTACMSLCPGFTRLTDQRLDTHKYNRQSMMQKIKSHDWLDHFLLHSGKMHCSIMSGHYTNASEVSNCMSAGYTHVVKPQDINISVCFAVGKTSLITRFMYDSFDNTYQVSYSLR